MKKIEKRKAKRMNKTSNDSLTEDGNDCWFFIHEKAVCANCEVEFIKQRHKHVQYHELFHDTCTKCVQTCSSCGCENGYMKNNTLLSYKSCDSCNKESCMSCGVTISCDTCGLCLCEQCIEEGKIDIEICKKLKRKMKLLKMYKNSK